MLAFTNTTHTKDQVLAQIRAHAAADEIVKGQYWDGGKGCAIGCTIHSDSHAEYETRFGVPQMLARLEDCIFEGLPNGQSKAWPERFMSAINPGQDLSLVGWKFLHWILTDPVVNPGIENALVKDAVKQCADVIFPLTKGEKITRSTAESAWSAASAACSTAASAASAAWSTAESAACSTAESASESAAWSTAESTARSGAWSAESAESAASAACSTAASAACSTAESASESAAWSAARSAACAARSAACAARGAEESAASAASAARSAESAAYVRMSDKIIELIAEA